MIDVILRELKKCTEEQLLALRDVRNQISIRKSMYTEHEITKAEHIAWIEYIKTDKTQIVFLVLINDMVSGLVSLNAFDRLHNKSDWAFYLSEHQRGGLGAVLEFAFLDFVFSNLQLEKLNCEVIETNENVIKLHKRFSFVEEGLRRENIIKDGRRIGVYFLGLTKSDWVNNKASIKQAHDTLLKKYNISIEYVSV